jgi:hypothetical protein
LESQAREIRLPGLLGSASTLGSWEYPFGIDFTLEPLQEHRTTTRRRLTAVVLGVHGVRRDPGTQ